MKLDLDALLPRDPAVLATRLGAGRAAIAALILAAPTVSVRLLGTDTATARRASWLTRMMGVRDGAIGAGALAAGRSSASGAVPWLLAGAAADAVDAVVLAGALRQRRIKGVLPRAVVGLAAATAAVGAVTAVRLRGH